MVQNVSVDAVERDEVRRARLAHDGVPAARPAAYADAWRERTGGWARGWAGLWHGP
ncbi:hypothetical protein GCM10010274_01720 [Streptomyces lavendofoliae]|uniref:Uncharacterized protein n=1 Tax=Streptomyces lavendofoliae TaxID=67314 RepID=A0A918M1M0_9ACTN|nr:hypothetical protein GCM10010274_01720 [Streptomyces lavendofoliae]